MSNNIFTEAKNSICIKSTIISLLPRGKREGKYWVALNPTRNDDNLGSFKVKITTGQFYDYATNEGGDIISLYAYLKGCSQYEAACQLLGRSVSFKNDNMAYTPAKVPKPPKVNLDEYINKLWNESLNPQNSIVESYLNHRGLVLQDIPRCIRYHPSLYHKPTCEYFPAMLSAVTRYGSDKIIALHRTYLKVKGEHSSKADVLPNKMMLGQVKGGTVMLTSANPKLVITEGIETALSVYAATGFSTWASLSASGMVSVQVPPTNITQEIIIAADADATGIAAANKLAARLLDEGYKVSIATPSPGKDFNDLMKETKQ